MLRVIKICCLVAIWSVVPGSLSGQSFKVLHYSEISGFDHQTRSASFAMFQQLGAQLNFAVDHDSTGAAFDDLTNLQQYKVVVFSNTTGDAILNNTQKQNLEAFMANGGRFIGIHSASDTYRHSSSNGTHTGSWDWYAAMLGASVRENPNHVNGTPVYKIHQTKTHDILKSIPAPWYKAEEYYYWEGGYFNPANDVIQKVEQTVGPNGLVNSYDSARAVTWVKDLPGGGKCFYTSLGHTSSNFTSDTVFFRLIKNALLWITGQPVGIEFTEAEKSPVVAPNPASTKLYFTSLTTGETLFILDGQGKLIRRIVVADKNITVDIDDLPAGLYLIKYPVSGRTGTKKILKE